MMRVLWGWHSHVCYYSLSCVESHRSGSSHLSYDVRPPLLKKLSGFSFNYNYSLSESNQSFHRIIIGYLLWRIVRFIINMAILNISVLDWVWVISVFQTWNWADCCCSFNCSFLLMLLLTSQSVGKYTLVGRKWIWFSIYLAIIG